MLLRLMHVRLQMAVLWGPHAVLLNSYLALQQERQDANSGVLVGRAGSLSLQ